MIDFDIPVLAITSDGERVTTMSKALESTAMAKAQRAQRAAWAREAADVSCMRFAAEVTRFCKAEKRREFLIRFATAEAEKARADARKATSALVQARKLAVKGAKASQHIATASATIAETAETVRLLKAQLAKIERLPMPGGPTKSRTPEAVNISAERDALDLECATTERLAKETADPDLKAAHIARLAEVRARLEEISKRGLK